MAEDLELGDGRPLRRLLPAVALARPPLAAAPEAAASSSRKPKIQIACEPCRKHKAKCTGERPTCRRCVKRHLPCAYAPPREEALLALRQNIDTLRSRSTVQDELLDMLKTLPDKDAQQILQRIRQGTDFAAIVDQIKAGDVLLQLAVVPESRMRYELPYRAEMPVELLVDNPYLESMLYQGASLFSGRSSSSLGLSEHAAPRDSEASDAHSLYIKPFHAAQVQDPLLFDVQPSRWTAVCDDDVLMRELLGVFFRCEYHFTTAFQKDCFLRDMATGSRDFCSELLVNAVLGYACVCFPRFSKRAEYWNPSTLGYRFIAEAKRLWELEASEPRITTIQAGVILNVYYNLSGLDEIGKVWRVQAIALAHELGLFEGRIAAESDRVRAGMEFTAWALYMWEALSAFSFMERPLITRPPNITLPDPTVDPDWYGEVWVQYPMSPNRLPSMFGQEFRAKAQFRIIMNEFCLAAYSGADKPAISLEKANGLHVQLRRWWGGLPESLAAKNIVLPGHLQLHMYYHNLILSIYEPLLEVATDQDPSPRQLVADANRHLQTLVRLYYLRHGYEAMDLFIVIPLMLAGFKALDMIDDHPDVPDAALETLRSTLMLVAKGLASQRRNHYLAEALFRVIRGRMRPAEAALLKESIDLEDDEGDEKKVLMQAVRSHWPVSVVRKKEDLDAVVLKNLVQNYASMDLRDGVARMETDGSGRSAGEKDVQVR